MRKGAKWIQPELLFAGEKLLLYERVLKLTGLVSVFRNACEKPNLNANVG